MNFTSREFRDALGLFPTGVTIITANPEGFAPFGMTANSFASVSLEPPLVLWSLQKNSDTLPAFEVATHYAVNVLDFSQQHLSSIYAKKGNHTLAPEHFSLGRSGCPVIRGAIATFECAIDARHDGGDHIILVGRVQEMQSLTNRKPLVFFSGQYRELR